MARRRHVHTAATDTQQRLASSSSSSKVPKDVTSPLSPISPWPPLSDEPDVSDSTELQQQPKTKDHTPHVIAVQEELPTAKEIYGSIAVLLTGLGCIVYLAWAFLPPSMLDKLGWTWYPARYVTSTGSFWWRKGEMVAYDRDWALIVPCWLMLLVLTAYWCYAAMSIYLTPSFDSIGIITDSSALASTIPEGNQSTPVHLNMDGGMPPAVDIPIDIVNRVLYPATVKSG